MKKKTKYKQPSKRSHRICIMLNDEELRAVERYQKRYRVRNRSRLIRETLLTKILNRFSADSPTLFPDMYN
ncbi:MAG: hypothetical protein IJ834_00200 [Paludibacteraceae bacterium]|nr:hypothetical protein [Paludibacteraceae bacterium]